MHQYPAPIEDDQNPCYCPSISAVSYLQSLRRPLSQKNANAVANAKPKTRYSKSSRFARMLSQAHRNISPSDPQSLLPSFAELLNESMNEEDLSMLQPAVVLSTSSTLMRHERDYSASTSAYFLPSSAQHTAGRAAYPVSSAETRSKTSRHRLTGQNRAGSRASSTFSDLQGPVKHERSSVSVNENSFELSAKADRLNFFPAPARKTEPKEWFSPCSTDTRVGQVGVLTASETRRKMRKLEYELFGPPIGTESPRGLKSLITRIDAILPGIRLREKLLALDALSHQRIVDALSTDGNLNPRILDLLRMSEVDSIDLTASMTDEEGLNLDARVLLHVFAKPNSFLFLSELNMSGASLNDADLRYIHHLPRLSRLWISNTGIGNEAVFLLVPLKRSLAELDLAFNSEITDDAFPALAILRKLRFLTLLSTRVEMPGLRTYCTNIRAHGRTMELEVPRECEIYIERLGRQYILQPEAPLISDPALVSELSTKALKANLAAHAQHNPQISVDGSKEHVAERLQRLLELREGDLAVREVLWKGEGAEGSGTEDGDADMNVNEVEAEGFMDEDVEP